jgi:outer membrane beta-barrel protein
MTCAAARRVLRPGRVLDPVRFASLTLALAAAGAAGAGEVVYGPDGAPTVVQNKLHSMSGLWEVGGRVVTALNSAYVQHTGGVLSVTYHPNESFDFGVELSGNLTSLSDLATRIRTGIASSSTALAQTPPQWKNELAHADQLKYGAFVVARLAPVYGKLSLASELAIHLQVYVLLGVGAGGVHRESINLCAVSSAVGCPDGPFLVTDSVKPMAELGGGLRFYLGDRLSLLVELRELLYPTSLQTLTDPNVATSVATQSSLGNLADVALGLAGTF